MKTIKLIHGNTYFYGPIVFNRGEEVEVNDEVAEALAKEEIVNYDSDLGNFVRISYFKDVTAPKASTKTDTKTEAKTAASKVATQTKE